MREPKPIGYRELIQEAERAFEGLPKERLTAVNGKPLNFWYCWDGVRVSVQTGWYRYSDFLELMPRRRLAVFCKDCKDYPAEEKVVIEANLHARGYRIVERDSMWFCRDRAGRRTLDQQAYAA